MIKSQVNLYILVPIRNDNGITYNITSLSSDNIQIPFNKIENGSTTLQEHLEDIIQRYASIDTNLLNFVLVDAYIENDTINVDYFCWINAEYIKKESDIYLIDIQNIINDKHIQKIIRFI